MGLVCPRPPDPTLRCASPRRRDIFLMEPTKNKETARHRPHLLHVCLPSPESRPGRPVLGEWTKLVTFSRLIFNPTDPGWVLQDPVEADVTALSKHIFSFLFALLPFAC